MPRPKPFQPLNKRQGAELLSKVHARLEAHHRRRVRISVPDAIFEGIQSENELEQRVRTMVKSPKPSERVFVRSNTIQSIHDDRKRRYNINPRAHYYPGSNRFRWDTRPKTSVHSFLQPIEEVEWMLYRTRKRKHIHGEGTVDFFPMGRGEVQVSIGYQTPTRGMVYQQNFLTKFRAGGVASLVADVPSLDKGAHLDQKAVLAFAKAFLEHSAPKLRRKAALRFVTWKGAPRKPEFFDLLFFPVHGK